MKAIEAATASAPRESHLTHIQSLERLVIRTQEHVETLIRTREIAINVAFQKGCTTAEVQEALAKAKVAK